MEYEGAKKEKIIFKVVQIKFLAMHITTLRKKSYYSIDKKKLFSFIQKKQVKLSFFLKQDSNLPTWNTKYSCFLLEITLYCLPCWQINVLFQEKTHLILTCFF